jgi:glycosyltransferase involved in cell wall biosynthesis
MKICYIADGSSIHTQRRVGYFAEAGCEVSLITDYPADIKGVEIHYIKPVVERKPLIRHPIQIARVIKLVRSIRPDILHAHYVAEDGWYGALVGYHPFVLSAWGSDIYDVPTFSPFHRYITSFALKMADLITVNSVDLRSRAIALGALPERVELHNWGIDLDSFDPGVESDVRHSMGIGEGAPVVLSMRGFKPFYNIDIVVEAIPLVLAEIPETRFIIIGEGHTEAELKGRVEALGIQDAVHFVGRIPSQDVPRYLVASDVSLSVPSHDGTAATLLESMACGVPLVVSDVPSNREWIEDGYNGLIVPVRDRDSLARAVVRLLKSPDERGAFRLRNLGTVREKADRKVRMARMMELYQKLLAHSRGRASGIRGRK